MRYLAREEGVGLLSIRERKGFSLDGWESKMESEKTGKYSSQESIIRKKVIDPVAFP